MSGNQRTIGTASMWVPLFQDVEAGRVVWNDVRFSADNGDNSEFNIGFGYREMVLDAPVLGDGVAGVHGWFDRRVTKRGSHFNQVTLGGEWFADDWELKANAYAPLNNHKEHRQSNSAAGDPRFTGTQLVVNTDQSVREEALPGFDLELGLRVPYMDEYTDSTRIYAAGYHFEGDEAENVTGYRARIRSDITEDISVGFRYQHDDVRGSQGFFEATLRFPFGNKRSYQEQGLWARMDESAERDIDIVSNEKIVDDGLAKPVKNAATGETQQVVHVDNTNTSGTEDGSAEAPYDTLAEAQSAAGENSVIYVHSGNGSSTGLDAGVTLSKSGVKLIGAGVALTPGLLGVRLPDHASGLSDDTALIEAGSAPVLANAGGAIVTVSANDVVVSGVTVDGTAGSKAFDGIVVEADGAGASAQNVEISNVTAQNNRMGIYIHGADNGAVSAKVENSVTASNAWHGIAVYDDTDATFEADLGGGTLGSSGKNVLAGNTLEDLAVEYDGRALSAQNNWWGYATGPDQDDPSDGVKPQIYYGAPLNEGLAGHWTFDTEWTSPTTAYDRSGNDNDGTINGAKATAGQNKEALNFDGVDDRVVTTDLNVVTNSPADAFTMLAWIKTDQAQLGDGIIHSNQFVGVYTCADGGFSIQSNGDNAGNCPAGSFINDNTWKHIAATYIEGTQYLGYINGNEIYDVPTIDTEPDSGYVTEIGHRVGSGAADFFEGEIDGAMVFTRALDPSEISELYRMDTSSSVNVSGYLTSSP